ncbi:MAG: hypothetical protein LBU87_02900 [Lactobacillales bacterium]|jgi:hypothetical protein|nr:hypothetical protein [Lactobacillales bacterium]
MANNNNIPEYVKLFTTSVNGRITGTPFFKTPEEERAFSDNFSAEMIAKSRSYDLLRHHGWHKIKNKIFG